MFTMEFVGSIPLSLRRVKYCAKESDVIAYRSGMEKTEMLWHCSAQVRSSAFLDSSSFLLLCP